MIKITELRIGNFVTVSNKEKTRVVTSLDVQKVRDGFYRTIGFGIDKDGFADAHLEFNINPIPLTEEWLLTFGFEKYTWADACFMKTKFGDLMIRFLRDEIHLFFTNVSYDSQGIKFSGTKYVGSLNSTQNVKYVHQLQNLYFMLSGQELEIKELNKQ